MVRIFEMSAEGLSLKKIAKRLNSEGVPTSRPRAGKKYGSWCPTALRAMLRNEIDVGRTVWSRAHFIKRRERTSGSVESGPGASGRFSKCRSSELWTPTSGDGSKSASEQ